MIDDIKDFADYVISRDDGLFSFVLFAATEHGIESLSCELPGIGCLRLTVVGTLDAVDSFRGALVCRLPAALGVAVVRDDTESGAAAIRGRGVSG